MCLLAFIVIPLSAMVCSKASYLTLRGRNRLGMQVHPPRRTVCLSQWARMPWVALFLSVTLPLTCVQRAIAADSPALLSPAEAARTMEVPKGFRVTLFAGEPDVRQPVGMCMDDRGRLWVAEAYNYPNHGTRPGDRIVIFADTNGDGRFDQRTVFTDRLNYVTGVEVGFGGVWVVSPPYFYFFPDRNHDDRPDRDPQLLLDGLGTHANAHNLANALAWGPDGWLYGTHGRTNWSLIGKPGTPDAKRIRFDGGVYRYHPVRHIWESYADGTTNPWGIDWNEHGEAFVSNCVNPHLFHVIQGAHYEPWRNRDSSRYAYERIATIADHLHYLGGDDFHAGVGSKAEDLLGGGHAHCGIMIYLGDNWPAQYRDTIFMNNIHGHRINNDLPRRFKSGYRASHATDLMRSADPWFVGINLLYGPDGAVYVTDWSDTGECHSVTNTQKETGRIFRITYGNIELSSVDVDTLSTAELVQRQWHPNDWHVRHARRLLQERAAMGQSMVATHAELKAMYRNASGSPQRLRALWALHVTGGADQEFLTQLLQSDDEYCVVWAIRLLCEHEQPSENARQKFHELAANTTSAFVRLYLASSLQRLSPEYRWPLAERLLEHAEDASDPNIPHMIWYGIEPLVHDDTNRFIDLATHTQIPMIRQHIAKRVASLPPSAKSPSREPRKPAE